MQNWVVRSEIIQHVEGKRFENFCYKLLDFEVSYRHNGGRVGGPPPEYYRDDGMDLLVEIERPPKNCQGIIPPRVDRGRRWAHVHQLQDRQ